MQRTDDDGVPSGTTELGARVTEGSVPARIGVLIAHRSPLISAGLASVLSAQPDFDVICCRDNGCPQRASTQELASVSVAVTDCTTGLEIAAVASNACQVVIVTEDESEVSIRLAVHRGVSGYLLLASECEAIVNAVRSAHKGAAVFDPIVAAKIVASLAAPVLSSRESEVLSFMMEGLSDKTIARRLRRSLGTVKSHVKSVLAKLDVKSRSEAAAVARRRGLVSPETVPVTLPAVRRSTRIRRIPRSACGRPNARSAGGEFGGS
jgi:two-component system NarL family response regulator